MSKSKIKNRYIFIDSRVRKKKKEYFIVVTEYNPSLRYTNPTYFNYPFFRRTFSSKKTAKEYAFRMIEKIESRYKNIRFIARELFE